MNYYELYVNSSLHVPDDHEKVLQISWINSDKKVTFNFWKQNILLRQILSNLHVLLWIELGLKENYHDEL